MTDTLADRLERALDDVKGMCWGSQQMDGDWAAKKIDEAIAALRSQEWVICDGCKVADGWEHKCHGLPCACQECQRARIWVGDWEPGFMGDGVPTGDMGGFAHDRPGAIGGEVEYVRADLAAPPEVE